MPPQMQPGVGGGAESDNDDNLSSIDVPAGQGLVIALSASGQVTLSTTLDQRYPDMHPNAYAPARLRNVRLLHGGGSGTAVFAGEDPDVSHHDETGRSGDGLHCRSLVMKHSGPRDSREVFSLVTIRSELIRRGQELQQTYAAVHMQERLPEFLMAYISPHHVRDRSAEVWHSLRISSSAMASMMKPQVSPLSPHSPRTVRNLLTVPASHRKRQNSTGSLFPMMATTAAMSRTTSTGGASSTEDDAASVCSLSWRLRQISSGALSDMGQPIPQSSSHSSLSALPQLRETVQLSQSSFPPKHGKRDIAISNDSDRVEVDVNRHEFILYIPDDDNNLQQYRSRYQQPRRRSSRWRKDTRTVSDGMNFLQEFAKELIRLQEEHNWKITLAQKCIGGPNPQNGADVLTSGRLHGPLLTKLLEEFTYIINQLRSLTLPDEKKGLKQVQKELKTLEKTRDITKVSKTVDAFCGSALVKNYHPESGRFPHLRNFGVWCRNITSSSSSQEMREEYFLTPQEEVPIRFLGRILEPSVHMDTIFAQTPAPRSALDILEQDWLQLLRQATQLKHPSATSRIWTCGLTDAGLHNTFLSLDRGLELFDLGEPRVMPQPAFLTKFLMSIYHSFGMQDDEDKTSWVQRFDVDVRTDMLCTTPATARALPYANRIFDTTTQHFVNVLFEDDPHVERLLVHYTVLQLLSDASFCLQRWEDKGGGKNPQRHGKNNSKDSTSKSLEKWLWRSVWDLYAASLLYQQHLAEKSKK